MGMFGISNGAGDFDLVTGEDLDRMAGEALDAMLAGFGDSGGDGVEVSVGVYPFVVFVSKLEAKDAWGEFAATNRLKPTRLRRGSSFAGMSEAELELVPGAGAGGAADNLDVTEAEGILSRGDRVVVCIDETAKPGGGTMRPLWAGYCLSNGIHVGGESEKAGFRCLGPEWFWGGDGGGVGGSDLLNNQGRAKPEAWDDYLNDPATPIPYDGWSLVSLPVVFNPEGRPNAIDNRDFAIMDPDDETITAPLFADPDFKVGESKKVAMWALSWAAAYIATALNAPGKSGIAYPAAEEYAALETNPPTLRSVDVTGLALWPALRKIMGPNFGFYVTNIPEMEGEGINAKPKWEGFKLEFFSRATARGGNATVTLNPRNTPMASAVPSITRLALDKSAGKLVTRVKVYGRVLRHIMLRYWGACTPNLADPQKAYALQHGWTEADGNLKDYSGANNVVDAIPIDASGANATTYWQDHLTTRGMDFITGNQHIFRLFVWNEAGEWKREDGGPQCLYGPETYFDYYTPNHEKMPFAKVRRRRRLTDTLYKQPGKDEFVRIPPAVFVAINKAADPTSPGGVELTPWLKLPSSAYRIDHERAAIWLTMPDLAEFFPFVRKEADDIHVPSDDRTMATLLLQGRLHMAVEGCVEDDDASLAVSDYDEAAAGLKMDRLLGMFAKTDLMKITPYDWGDGFAMSAGDLAAIDDTAEAKELADYAKSSGQDLQIHASISVAASAPYQAIGQFIPTIAGRNLSLVSAGTRAAQIVAAEMDCVGLAWELLTESAAKSTKGLRGHERREFKVRAAPMVPGIKSGASSGALEEDDE